LLDWKLPGLSGLEVLRWLRAQPAYAGLPVVVFSSSGQESDIQSAYGAGADAYLVKPGSLERLLQIIRGITNFLASPSPHIDLLPAIESRFRRNQAPTAATARP
jgi:DNA-binding response OmpR family regulator